MMKIFYTLNSFHPQEPSNSSIPGKKTDPGRLYNLPKVKGPMMTADKTQKQAWWCQTLRSSPCPTPALGQKTAEKKNHCANMNVFLIYQFFASHGEFKRPSKNYKLKNSKAKFDIKREIKYCIHYTLQGHCHTDHEVNQVYLKRKAI